MKIIGLWSFFKYGKILPYCIGYMVRYNPDGMTLKQKFRTQSKNQEFYIESEDDLERLLEVLYANFKWLDFWEAIQT